MTEQESMVLSEVNSVPGLTIQLRFDSEYFKTGRFFIVEEWEVKMPRQKGDKYEQIRIIRSYLAMVTGVSSLQKSKKRGKMTMDKRYDNLNNFNSVLSSEFSDAFVNEMKHRVEISYHKYGPARKNFAEGRVDALKTAEMCLEAFKKDKNTEHLIDAANYLMFRWRFPMLGEEFKPTDSSGSVGTFGTPINFEKE